MASATPPLAATPAAALYQVAASRVATASQSGAVVVGDRGLALHLTAQGGAAVAMASQTSRGVTTTREQRTVAAAYQVDLDVAVAFSAALANQQARLSDLDPRLLDEFTAAFNALDGSRAHQRAFFRATDHLFDGLEQEVGLSATALDDEAEVVKGAVRDFFQQVQAADRLTQQGVGGGAAVADRLGQQVARVVATVAASAAPPVHRLGQASQLLDGVAVEGGARHHLRHLVDRLLARGDQEGRGEAVRARLDGARDALASAAPQSLRRAGHALEQALDHREPAETAADRFVGVLTGDRDHDPASDHAATRGAG